MLLTLSVVGRVELTPADPLDARVAAAFDAHQRRATEGGRLLGPDAVARRRRGSSAGWGPRSSSGPAPGGSAPSQADWRRSGSPAGWVPRASSRSSWPPRPSAYARRRLAEAAAGQLAVTVDHADLLVLPPSRSGTGMSRSVWTWARLAGVAATFAVLVWRLGTGPFLDGVRTVDGQALAAAAGIAVLTTVCCAWRWKIVARGLGIDLPLPAAVAAYYRSQFLNVTLPGGVVGDVHRGYSHGRDVSDVGRGLRAVAWERSAGQVVQAVLTVVVLLALPSPVRSCDAGGRDRPRRGCARRRAPGSCAARPRAAPAGRACGTP